MIRPQQFAPSHETRRDLPVTAQSLFVDAPVGHRQPRKVVSKPQSVTHARQRVQSHSPHSLELRVLPAEIESAGEKIPQ